MRKKDTQPHCRLVDLGSVESLEVVVVVMGGEGVLAWETLKGGWVVSKEVSGRRSGGRGLLST